VANQTWRSLLLKKVILEDPRRIWSIGEMALAATVSESFAEKAVKELADQGILSRKRPGTVSLADAEKLRIYLENSSGLFERIHYFTPEAPMFCAKRIDEAAKRTRLQYAITGELGLWSYYKHVQPLIVQMYVKRAEEAAWERVLQKELKYFPCPPARATLILLPTNDHYPFMRQANYDGYQVPQFLQVYLDCFVLGGRTGEGAREAWKSIRG
jgi:hypothetical protein